ncbi:MAG: sigma-70 family RNA polymerase sigma factor [Candidatus Acidiferrales bacterium]
MYSTNTEIEDLYRQHGPALLLFAIAMTRERSSAQDAVQQVFVQLIERGLGDVVHAKAYLYRCVRNAVLNSAKAHEHDVALDEDTPWFDVLNRDFAEELSLRRGLRALPSEQRQVVVLRVWCGLTYAETASLLEISANTVASRYRYALEKLREAMGAREDSCADARR